jgi:hypothetical protein
MVHWSPSGLIPVRTCDYRAEPCPVERLEQAMLDLPSGTITFLVTGIKGSTAL